MIFTAPDPPVIVPLAKVIVSAVKLMAVLPDELVNMPEALFSVPVPAFAVMPPGPVTVLRFVIPPPVKETKPDPLAVIALLIVNNPGVCNVILGAPDPAVVIAPDVANVPVLLMTDKVPPEPETELLAVNVILRLLLKLILPDVLFVKVTALARLLALLKLIPAPALTVKLFAPPLPIVKAPVPVIEPVPTPPPTLLNVKSFGVVTALFKVIAAPLVWNIHAPDGFVTPLTVPFVLNVPV